MQELGVGPPLAIMLSFVDVEGFGLDFDGYKTFTPSWTPLDRDILRLPIVTVNSIEDDVGVVMKPAFDRAWQAFGRKGSPCYDTSGKWVGLD